MLCLNVQYSIFVLIHGKYALDCELLNLRRTLKTKSSTHQIWRGEQSMSPHRFPKENGFRVRRHP